MITNETFAPFAFPVARVRYNGDSSNWSARIYHDSERSYRARASYDPGIGGGAKGALAAALKCFEKCLADNSGLATYGDYIAVPGDLSAGEYTFTFVPAYFFNGE